MRRTTRTILTAAVLAGAGSGALSGQSTDWAHYGGTQWNERHATLTQITTENVVHLVPLMWPLIVALISDKAGSHQGAVQGLAGSTGAIAAIIGLLLGGLLYAPLQGWLFVVAASMIGIVGILALWSRKQPA